MASFDAINYSLRPSKSIQRHLIFEGLSLLRSRIDFARQIYVGFGSIWFTDFILAHKLLGISDMISIESHEIGIVRAGFNKPFATIEVRPGLSTAVLPDLLQEERLRRRPWLVWLDYDYGFDESVRDDVVSIIEKAPENTVILATFSGHEMEYGRAPDRPDRLKALFGNSVPDDLPKNSCKDERMQQTLADLAMDFMQSTANDMMRPGGFIPAFRMIYRDGAPMVTVGGVLPSRGAAAIVSDAVTSDEWYCRPEHPIVAPHLTIREAAVLQSQLPRETPLDRDALRALGFDLEDEQLQAFQRYYRHYPAFAQIVA